MYSTFFTTLIVSLPLIRTVSAGTYSTSVSCPGNALADAMNPAMIIPDTINTCDNVEIQAILPFSVGDIIEGDDAAIAIVAGDVSSITGAPLWQATDDGEFQVLKAIDVPISTSWKTDYWVANVTAGTQITFQIADDLYEYFCWLPTITVGQGSTDCLPGSDVNPTSTDSTTATSTTSDPITTTTSGPLGASGAARRKRTPARQDPDWA